MAQEVRKRLEADLGDESFNYDAFSLHAKMTGVGAFMGTVKAASAQDQGGKAENVSKDYLMQVCDTGSRKTVIPEKKPSSDWECTLCQVTCNSELMYDQHMAGTKHLKRVRLSQRIAEGKDSERVKHLGLTDIDYKKVGGLQKMLKDTKEPVVGLQYMKEITPATMPETYDVAYCCSICQLTCLASNMYSHIIGFKHRYTYLHLRLGLNVKDKKEAQRRAQEIEEQEGRRIETIASITSDDEYPWPSGHKPGETTQAAFGGPADAPGSALVNMAKIPIGSNAQAAVAFDAVSALLKRLTEYKASTVLPKHAKEIYSFSENMLNSLTNIMSIPPAREEASREASDLFQFRHSEGFEEWQMTPNPGGEGCTGLPRVAMAKALAGRPESYVEQPNDYYSREESSKKRKTYHQM